MRKAGLANSVRISAVHLTRFPTVLSFQPGRGALRPSAHLCPSTQDPVNLLGSWVDFTSREGSAELGGKWDNCGEVGGGNHAARQEKAMEKGRTSSWGDQLLALAGARWELHGQRRGQVAPGRSGLCGQAELASFPGPAICEFCDPGK